MANPVRLLLRGLGFLLLTACAAPQILPEWPDELPARSWFQQQWRQDVANRSLQSEADYLLWVQRFFEGFNMVPGWLTMMKEVRARVPAEQWMLLESRLHDLGGSIGSEWAKHNDVRKLDTRTAAVWRDALMEALSQDDLEAYLYRLEQDVGALVGGQLDMDSIRFERYYIDDFDF